MPQAFIRRLCQMGATQACVCWTHIEGQVADASNGGGKRGGRALAAAVWKAKVLSLCHHCCVPQRYMHLLMHGQAFVGSTQL